MMKVHFLLMILAFGSYQCQEEEQKCILDSSVKNKPFPDIFNKSLLFYQITVEYTLPNVQESIYYTEYYDITEKKGRVDIQEEGESTKFYYYYATSEAFEVSENTCKIRNITQTPEFMRSAPYGWNIVENDRIIHGPSAMFRYAYLQYMQEPNSVVYMGESKHEVRGFKTKYWKRCLKENLTAEYHFMGEGYEEALGLKYLKEIPLRIDIYGYDHDLEAKLLPQKYEFLNFIPMVIEGVDTFELPPGYGCTENRVVDEDVVPDIPDFTNNNLMIRGEALYTDQTKDNPLTYASTFMLALDLSSDHMAYSYTSWKQSSDKSEEKVANILEMNVIDLKNNYVYVKDFLLDRCKIYNTPSYPPRYNFPQEGGYVDLTDPAILFPNNEFVYLGEGMERGLEVNIFEAVLDDYMAGNKKIPKAVITHYYLKPDIGFVSSDTVYEALIKISMRFYDVSKQDDEMVKKPNADLTFNLFGFSTQIRRKHRIFSIKSCFKNNDESMWITVGFEAETLQIEKMKKLGPTIEENVFGFLETSTEITPIRTPEISMEFTEDSVLVSMLLLQRPPVGLDFGDLQNDMTIGDGSEGEGINTLDECSSKCSVEGPVCWGYALCGATCFIGITEIPKFKSQKDCKLFKRTNNGSLPTMQNLARNVQREVELRQLRLVVPSDDEPIDLVANYFEAYSTGESDELFKLMGKELNPRLRVVKTSFKLNELSGNSVKNFGQLSYADCQNLCLDYKECETLSYCLGDEPQCILSKTYGEDIPQNQMTGDNFCAIVTRKYSDKFTRSPGNILSQSAKKVLNADKHEDCSRACVKETSFKCLSFDHCPNSQEKSCRLHDVHFLDKKTKETSTVKDTICGHYSRKFSNDFKMEEDKKTVGTGLLLSKNVTLEECSKECVEYNVGKCSGFDFCQDSTITATQCIILTTKPSEIKTTYSSICRHYTKENFLSAPESSHFSKGTAAGLGFLFFIIGGVVGALIVFGIAYYRVNRSS